MRDVRQMGHARRRSIHQLSSTLLSQRRDNRLSVAFIPQWIDGSRPIVALPKSSERSRLYRSLWPPPLWATALLGWSRRGRDTDRHVGKPCGKGFANGVVPLAAEVGLVGRSRHVRCRRNTARRQLRSRPQRSSRSSCATNHFSDTSNPGLQSDGNAIGGQQQMMFLTIHRPGLQLLLP